MGEQKSKTPREKRQILLLLLIKLQDQDIQKVGNMRGSNFSEANLSETKQLKGAFACLRLLIFLFCIVGFLGVRVAAAHNTGDAITVADVASDRGNLEDFVSHAAAHLSEATSFGEVLGLLNEFRNDGGDWNDGSTYLILLSRSGGVYLHSKSKETRELEDQDWSRLLKGCSQESWNELLLAGGGCVKHDGQEEGAPSGYAVPFASVYIPFANPDSQAEQFVLVGGLDYTPEAEIHASFEDMVDDLVDHFVETSTGGNADPNDPEFLEQHMQFRDAFFDAVTPEINSRDVSNPEDLKQFLNDAFRFITASFLIPLFDPVVLRRVFRFEGGPWRHISTYIYIMDNEGNVIFNGINRNIEQTNILYDHSREIREIAALIIEAAMKKNDTGSFVGGFVEYDWDDPAVEGDGEGGVGGSSPKLAYVKAFTADKDGLADNPRIYIFGSGLYLGSEDASDVDGGCVISGARGNAVGNTILSLFLIVSILLAAVCFKRTRFKERRQ